jgi:hypothetical protein
MQESQDLLEQSLKELLEMILLCMEGLELTTGDLQQVESELTDYDDLPGLVKIIKNVFMRLEKKIDRQFKRQIVTEPTEEEYLQLEKMVQKYESDIRNHIKVHRR